MGFFPRPFFLGARGVPNLRLGTLLSFRVMPIFVPVFFSEDLKPTSLYCNGFEKRRSDGDFSIFALFFLASARTLSDSYRLWLNRFSSAVFIGLDKKFLGRFNRSDALVELGSGFLISGFGPPLKGTVYSMYWRLILLFSFTPELRSLMPENCAVLLELVEPLRSRRGLDFSGLIDTRFLLKLILALLGPFGLLNRFFCCC